MTIFIVIIIVAKTGEHGQAIALCIHRETCFAVCWACQAWGVDRFISPTAPSPLRKFARIGGLLASFLPEKML